ncbi:MAG TPA: lytic transglycosylase domain-containing protein [Solirubrobacterales bacterium]|nr:lytic transglycosylase domain-containing protein [Solirubrobacterales bacterium]
MPRERSSAPLLAGLGAAAAFLPLVLGATFLALAAGGQSGCAQRPIGSLEGVPARLVPIYGQAAARYELGAKGPAVLAAINGIETDFGRNRGPSSAGAVGWMQFMPETWAAYGVDATGDGVRDPDDPRDAIFAATNYLRASGAPGDWRMAIFAYNHAGWYVEDVLVDARRYAAGGSEGTPAASCAAAQSGPAVKRMVAEAERIDALRLPYVWGGSHGLSPTPANGPFDCSSFVSHLLQVGGFDIPTMTTVGLVGWGEPGPGRWVTIHVKPFGPDAHTFLEFSSQATPASKRYAGTSATNPSGGPGWIPESAFDAAYLAGFQPRHPPGL